MDTVNKILLRHHLTEGGAVQKFFTSAVASAMDPYIPMRTGMLKNNKTINPDSIVYRCIYAAKQYESNAGAGIEGERSGGLRGKEWDARMWADRGDDITSSVKKFIDRG
jgi:hypothetical protein